MVYKITKEQALAVIRALNGYIKGRQRLVLLMLCLSCALSLGLAMPSVAAAGRTTLPRLAPASPAPLQGACDKLYSFHFTQTHIRAVESAAAGTAKWLGQPLRAHCVVRGSMYNRISAIDGQHYEIGFEIRLPLKWNGRFFYQNPAGTMGLIEPAYGLIGVGGELSPALLEGFAVLSTDGGHNRQQNPSFGRDPQARSDFGYATVLKLTPMAKALIQYAYGKDPDRSYIGGASNGGRLALVAAAKLAEQYDGIVANSPGIYLPLAAAGQLYTAQQLRLIATDPDDLSSAFTRPERQLLARAILARCDRLDGLDDLLVQDVEACRLTFKIERDVPRCSGRRNGSCLDQAQIDVVARLFRGPVNSQGQPFYFGQPYDPGILGDDWAQWKFNASIGHAGEPLSKELPVNERDPIAVGLLFQVPPQLDVTHHAREFAYHYDFDRDLGKLSASNGLYQESAMEFMLTPRAEQLQAFRQRGGKLLLVHGTADAVFAVDATTAWYEQLRARYKEQTADFARLFRVPGMNHNNGGLATDQFDALTALVRWVEYGEAPERLLAYARGDNHPGGANHELPLDWSPERSRPLCPYPLIARYRGRGDTELATSFECRR
jgi:alpha-beta hydrolase superfamily lysophospholipase